MTLRPHRRQPKSRSLAATDSFEFHFADAIHRKNKSLMAVLVVGILALTAIVPVAIIRSMAATGAVTYEAEAGSLSSPASLGSDNNAAAGQYVQFSVAGSGGGGLSTGGNDTSCIFNMADKPVQQAFCDGFDVPEGIGNRSGDLNGILWGVSRETGDHNLGQFVNTWPTFDGTLCGQTGNMNAPPHDVRICNGQLQEGVTDGGNVVDFAFYPKQPFDFTNRTGTVVFDVGNTTAGSHSAWPEFWITDKPVPTPFTHLDSWAAVPRHGIGIRFAGCTVGDGSAQNCPRSGFPTCVGVDEIQVIKNYDHHDATAMGDDCVLEPTADGQVNHYEIRISQNQVDVYASDPFSGTWNPTSKPLRHISRATNLGLTATKGLIWIEDAHYNANKTFNDSTPKQGTHSFTWDNVGFDGIKTYRDLAYDVLDNTDPQSSSAEVRPGTNLGYLIQANSSRTVTAKGVNKGRATTGLLTFNFYSEGRTDLKYSLNGHTPVTYPSPYGSATIPGENKNTIDIPIDLSDVVNGDNTITFYTGSQVMDVENIDLIMVDAAPVP